MTIRTATKSFFALSFLTSIFATESLAKNLLFEHSPRALQAEATLDALEPWETPIDGFFIRSHLGIPQINPKDWVLQIDGLVEKPLLIRYSDLQKMSTKTVHAVLECSGKGRGLQNPSVPGVQWQQGAVGNAEWKGVSLAELLAQAGVKPTAKYARIEGADKPSMPSVPGFVRSVPIAKLLKDDTLLAWSMNREALPTLHGGPLRLVLPGWYGENWIKWLTHITLTENEDPGFFMKKGYRIPQNPVSPGTKWDSATGVPIERILVQSFIVSPRPGQPIKPGILHVRGKAFSGEATISKVEISTDDGNTWQEAKLEPPHSSGGWQEFRMDLKVTYKMGLLSRATDSEGNQQPLEHVWNPGGYVRHAVERVEVGASGSVKPLQKFRIPSEVSSLVKNKCLTCHAQELIESQQLTRQQWEGVIKKMELFGVKLESTERDALLNSFEKAVLKPTKTKLVQYKTKNQDLPKHKRLQHRKFIQGQQLFGKVCAACHGKNGEGQIGPRLIGRSIPISEFHSAVKNGRVLMPPFGSILKQDDIVSIQDFLSREL